MEVQRPDRYVCQKRFRGSLQTDYTWALVVYYSTFIYDYCFYHYFRKSCKDTYRQYTTISFLFIRKCILELFRSVPWENLRYLQCKCRYFRQSILPKTYYSDFVCFDEFVAVWNSIRPLYGILFLFCIQGSSTVSQFRNNSAPCALASNGLTGVRSWYFSVIFNHKI